MEIGGADDEQVQETMAALPTPDRSAPRATTPPDEWDEDALLERLLAGDRAAAGALYDTLRPPIDRTLRRVLHHRGPDFEDHVQATFERILRGLAEDRFARRSSLKTWACAIASHVALDALRRIQRERGRSAEMPEQDVLPAGPSPSARIESLNELRRIQGILSDMNPDLAETLVMHDVLGHKLSEIGALRNATESATQSRLHRARAELKRRSVRPINRRQP